MNSFRLPFGIFHLYSPRGPCTQTESANNFFSSLRGKICKVFAEQIMAEKKLLVLRLRLGGSPCS